MEILKNTEANDDSLVEMVVNFIQGVELRRISEQKPGIFASKNIKKGELIIAEKPLAQLDVP